MEKFSFPGSQGHELAARLDVPEGDVRAYALFAHCFASSKDILSASRITKALVQDGIAVVRFDFTGLGASEGDFANTNFTSNVQDLVKAADYMRDIIEAPAVLIGHSLGGAAVLMAAKYIAEAKAVVTIGAPAEAAHVAHNFTDKHVEIMEQGQAEVSLGGRSFNIQRQFMEDILAQNPQEDIGNLNKALLVMHAPLDDVVGVENAAKIFSAAKHPKSYVSLDDADHLLRKAEDAKYVGHIISAWANRYLVAA